MFLPASMQPGGRSSFPGNGENLFHEKAVEGCHGGSKYPFKEQDSIGFPVPYRRRCGFNLSTRSSQPTLPARRRMLRSSLLSLDGVQSLRGDSAGPECPSSRKSALKSLQVPLLFAVHESREPPQPAAALHLPGRSRRWPPGPLASCYSTTISTEGSMRLRSLGLREPVC
jgi:hypothetical protein